MVKKKGNRVIKNIALIGIMAALIECAKLALAAFPNIEAVSLLISLFSYVFGWVGVVSALIFVCIEPAVWGMGTWFVSYLIYWPLLAMLFILPDSSSSNAFNQCFYFDLFFCFPSQKFN